MKPVRIVLPETREALQNLYPAAFENPSYLRLLEYLIFSTFEAEEKEGFLVIDATTLARLEGQEGRRVRSRNYVGKRLLEDFQRDVAPLVIEKHQYIESRARTVQRLQEPQLGKVLHHEFTSTRAERQERGVYLDTGRRPPKYPRTQIAEAQQARQEEVERITQEMDADHPAADLLRFLNTQPTTALKRIVSSNIDEAVRTVLGDAHMTVETKRYNLRLLHQIDQSIQFNPAPLYQLSPQDRTVRLFPLEGSYLSLSRAVRQVVLKGCDEFDLNAAQLTLAAHAWQISNLSKTLTEERLVGPWVVLGRLAGLPIKGSAKPRFDQKVVLKRAVYALLFGASEDTVRKRLQTQTEGVPGLTPAQADQLLASDLMRDILAARKNRRQQIQAEGGITTVFGKRVSLSPSRKGRNVRSLLVEEMQAYELYLLRPVVDYLLHVGSEEVTITAWQHDGFTLHYKDSSKRTRHNRNLNNLVKDRATKDLGMPKWQVRLERDTLD